MNEPQMKTTSKGCLIMAANSLGNPLDIPSRSLLAVKSADLVVFEEDRMARQVLKAAGIHREYSKYNEHHQTETLEDVKTTLSAGKTVVYMSDQGSPVIEDPGSAMLDIAYRCQSKVVVIPGPSSICAAISACPFATHGYLFAGFLPRETPDRLKKLRELQKLQTPLVIMDTPYRLKALLESCEEVFSKKRRILLAVDISGENEDFLLGTIEQLRHIVAAYTEKLNFVLIVDV